MTSGRSKTQQHAVEYIAFGLHVTTMFRICRVWQLPFILLAFSLSTSSALAQGNPRLVRVFVALADNEHQGIVPVPKALGNGDDPDRNLYWGAAFGVRTYFKRSGDWKEVATFRNLSPVVAERIVFLHQSSATYVVADGYYGKDIRSAIEDFLRSASGRDPQIPDIKAENNKPMRMPAASLSVYVGHDGLMDFRLSQTFQELDGSPKQDVIVLACASKLYFAEALRPTGARPLLWTTGLMAPEAYTLKAALDAWIRGESTGAIRHDAANAYAKYQRISLAAAERLFASGW